jgi:serine/threonine-protein phosphatase 4 regulatory subunit 2
MQHYNSVGKYLRAMEKALLVTSTIDAFPPLTEKEKSPFAGPTITLGSTPQSVPSTPLFSPIPFLHEDARRSKSRSPPPSPLFLGAGVEPEPKALGLVDELDDPGPGHLSDHPKALSSTTSRPLFESLEDRFVRAENSDEVPQRRREASGEDMVLDDTDDKENKG